jgi:hypothetical protein
MAPYLSQQSSDGGRVESRDNDSPSSSFMAVARFLAETAADALSSSNTTTDGDYTEGYYNDNNYDGGGGSSGKEETYGGKDKGPIPLDYSVLSVGVLTLGLILFVESCRHLLDHAAHGKPFFKGVLEMFYSECTYHILFNITLSYFFG